MSFFFQPALHIPRKSGDISKEYYRLRLGVFIGIFIGYAAYYLLRKNIAFIGPYLMTIGYGKYEFGLILSSGSLAYGLSKFFMGPISDRSNARVFLVSGLGLSILCNMFFVIAPGLVGNFYVLFILMFLNGWAQGMGWPACARILVHWFSKSERGQKTALWNIAHNIGSGLVYPIIFFGTTVLALGPGCVFYLPATIALFIAIVAYYLVRDTPQSEGLPSVEEFFDDTENYSIGNEKELSAKEILKNYILPNKNLWFIAIANIFVYLLRFGVIDWAPTYLYEVKGFNLEQSGFAYFLYEYAGIPGTLACGWLSDKIFEGRRAPTGVLFITFLLIAILVYWIAPASMPYTINIALMAVGFLIYGPVMLIGLYALDLVPKKAAGTAAGLTGLFGYVFGTVSANALFGYIVENYGWDGGFLLLLMSCVFAIFFIGMTWNAKTHSAEHSVKFNIDKTTSEVIG